MITLDNFYSDLKKALDSYRSEYQRRLSGFYSVLNQTLHSHREATRRLDHFLSTGFNVFKVIRPNENRLSEIIADLLDPFGSHGQQYKFLNAFLEVIERSDLKGIELSKVDREVPTYNYENPDRRIDIVVEFEKKAFGLGIENKKTDDGDREGQLEAYCCHLNKTYESRFCLLYLTPEGGDPDESSISRNCREELKRNGKLICISYRHHILKWIEECCQLCESDRFRWFLRDFMYYINGGQTMSMGNEREIILKHAQQSEENLKTALDINTAFNGDLHGQIIVGFLNKLETFVIDELRRRSDGLEWEIVIDANHKDLRHSPLKMYKRFGFWKKSWQRQYGVALESQQVNAGDVIIGVWRDYNQTTETGAPKFQPEDRLRAILNDRIERTGEHNAWWEWYCYLNEPYRSWGTDHNRTIRLKLHEDEAVWHVGQEFVRIIEVAAPIIDEHVQDLGKKRS